MKTYIPELTSDGKAYVLFLSNKVMEYVAKFHNVSIDIVRYTIEAKCRNQINKDFDSMFAACIETSLRDNRTKDYFIIRTWSK